MAVPSRVRRGTTGTDWYYFDGVNPMTLLGGGVGTTMQAKLGIGAVNDMTVAEFDALQEYLLNRKEAFDALAACAVCPTEAALGGGAAQIASNLQGAGG